MRAVYLPLINEFKVNSKLDIDGERAHHLINVVRLKKDEEVLCLNGNGFGAIAKIESISKKTVSLLINQIEHRKKDFIFDIAIGVLKKEAMEDVIKHAVEVGARTLYVVNTNRSQRFFNSDRMERLIESAVIQSNNFFTTKIVPLDAVSKLLEILPNYNHSFLLSMISKEKPIISIKSSDQSMIIIGPEGGFCFEEEEMLIGGGSIPVKFPAPILRAENALLCGVGYLYSKYIG